MSKHLYAIEQTMVWTHGFAGRQYQTAVYKSFVLSGKIKDLFFWSEDLDVVERQGENLRDTTTII